MSDTIKKSYTLNYVKIYVLNISAIILNVCSLFVVLPVISNNQELYGIYSICISLNVFFSYADLGFISAGMKYASEDYAKQNYTEEKKIIGFVGFILLLFVIVFSLSILAIAYKPQWLFSNLKEGVNQFVASKLLLTLALFAPVVILQRVLQMIYSIRLEDFIFQSINIVANLLKISSVFYFFRNEKYDLVGYFFFNQVVTVIGILVASIVAEKRYKSSLFSLIPHMRFSRTVYLKTKTLALSTFLLSLSWIVYYELDAYVLAKISTPTIVALYAVGLMLLSFVRSLFGAIFNPFTARFNHLIGLNDWSTLKSLYNRVIVVMLPLTLLPLVAVNLFVSPFILSWIGTNFAEAIRPASFLLMSNLLAFITYPAGVLIIARKHARLLYTVAFLLPIFYWLGVILFFHEFGFTTLAFMKFFSFVCLGIFYMRYSIKYLELTFIEFFNKYIFKVIPSLLFLGVYWYFLNPFLPADKSNLHLIVVTITIGVGAILSMVIYYLFTSEFRNYLNDIMYKWWASVKLKMAR